MIIYFKAIITILLGIAEFGFAVPYLVNASDDIMVFSGVALVCISLPLYFLIWKKEIKKLKNLITEE